MRIWDANLEVFERIKRYELVDMVFKFFEKTKHTSWAYEFKFVLIFGRIRTYDSYFQPMLGEFLTKLERFCLQNAQIFFTRSFGTRVLFMGPFCREAVPKHAFVRLRVWRIFTESKPISTKVTTAFNPCQNELESLKIDINTILWNIKEDRKNER